MDEVTENVKPENISEQLKLERSNKFTKPENWETKDTKSLGKQNTDPNNSRNNVREMEGNENGPNVSQQQDYLKYQKDGVLYYKNGQPTKVDILMNLISQKQNLTKLKCLLLNKSNTMHKEFKERLLELSDINLQRKLWLNIDNDTDLISSYSELFNSLIGDFDFDYEIKDLEDDKLKQDLQKLKTMLKEYKEPYPFDFKENWDDSIILNDSNWKKIVVFAKSLPLTIAKITE